LANKLNVSYVLIVGQEELKEQKVTIKNMSNGQQEKVAISKMLPYIKQDKENK